MNTKTNITPRIIHGGKLTKEEFEHIVSFKTNYSVSPITASSNTGLFCILGYLNPKDNFKIKDSSYPVTLLGLNKSLGCNHDTFSIHPMESSELERTLISPSIVMNGFLESNSRFDNLSHATLQSFKELDASNSDLHRTETSDWVSIVIRYMNNPYRGIETAEKYSIESFSQDYLEALNWLLLEYNQELKGTTSYYSTPSIDLRPEHRKAMHLRIRHIDKSINMPCATLMSKVYSSVVESNVLWEHHTSKQSYELLGFAPRYLNPNEVYVIYRNSNNKALYTRKASDWLRSMKPLVNQT